MALKIAHIGIAVLDMAAWRESFADLLGFEPVSGVVYDPIQNALLQMFKLADVYVELIAPPTEASHVHSVIKRRGEGPVHLCFETPDIEHAVASFRENGALVFKPPAPAVLFGGKRVAFVMMRGSQIVELVEEGWQAGMPRGDCGL
jgi:catechol 2,3-dioxygenase-like lactoylglutathione lyase family enzyme